MFSILAISDNLLYFHLNNNQFVKYFCYDTIVNAFTTYKCIYSYFYIDDMKSI